MPSRRQHAIGYSAGLGALLMVAFAAVDFPLHNPAVLGPLACLLAVACRWADLEPMEHPGAHLRAEGRKLAMDERRPKHEP